RLPVAVSRSAASVGPRAIIDSANRSMYDQCASSSSSSSRSAFAPTASRLYTKKSMRALHALDGLDLPCGDRLSQCAVIPLVHVGVRRREVGHGAVEPAALAEIRGDRDAIAGARMRTCERPAAPVREHAESARQDGLGLEAGLPVPELPDVEVGDP